MEKKKPTQKQLDTLFNHEIFKVLSEPVRIKIVKVLAAIGPSDINTIAGHFNIHRSVISRHLKQMYEAGILIKTKESRSTIYQVDGMAFLHKMESVVADIKEVLSYCCEDLYRQLYDSKMGYSEYLNKGENKANRK